MKRKPEIMCEYGSCYETMVAVMSRDTWNPLSEKSNVTLSHSNRRPNLMAASYATWKETPGGPIYPAASKEQIEAAIAVRHKEIEWNIRRLANLILDDEDRQQTEDLIMDLREERESLKRCLNVT